MTPVCVPYPAPFCMCFDIFERGFKSSKQAPGTRWHTALLWLSTWKLGNSAPLISLMSLSASLSILVLATRAHGPQESTETVVRGTNRGDIAWGRHSRPHPSIYMAQRQERTKPKQTTSYHGRHQAHAQGRAQPQLVYLHLCSGSLVPCHPASLRQTHHTQETLHSGLLVARDRGTKWCECMMVMHARHGWEVPQFDVPIEAQPRPSGP